MPRLLIAMLLVVLTGLLPTTVFSADDELVVLDTSSFWRCWFELKMPVFRKGASVVSLPEAFPKETSAAW